MTNRATTIAPSPLRLIPSLFTNPNPRSPSSNHAVRYPYLCPSNSPIAQRLTSHRPPRPRLSCSLDCSLDLPLLPFEPDEVLIPSEFKTLHLYEARFLALLEESLLRRKKHFVHFVLDPVLTGTSSFGASFAARYGCLVLVERVERLKIGALVSIRGVTRVSILKVTQMEPYMRGLVIPKQDNIPVHGSEIVSKLTELRDSLYSLHSLQIKLKAPKDELLQTQTKNSLTWAEREDYENCDMAFIPELAERLSFAAFQPVSGYSPSELLALQREKLQAMDLRDTSKRLHKGIEFIKQNIAMTAAKLAIQSLEI